MIAIGLKEVVNQMAIGMITKIVKTQHHYANQEVSLRKDSEMLGTHQ